MSIAKGVSKKKEVTERARCSDNGAHFLESLLSKGFMVSLVLPTKSDWKQLFKEKGHLIEKLKRFLTFEHLA